MRDAGRGTRDEWDGAGRATRGAPIPAANGASPNEPCTVEQLVREVAAVLAGEPTRDASRVPRTSTASHPPDSRDLVAALYDVPRFWPTLNGGVEVEPEMRERALRAAGKLALGAPLEYAVGRASFRHLTLDVDERVLIPRPETEQLVDIVLEMEGGRTGGLAVDVGTGSGAIALALASEGRFDRVVATDVSLDALAVARENVRLTAALRRAPVELVHCSLLDGLRGAGERLDVATSARVIVSNPPYIAYPEAAELPASVRDWEPPVALYSGADGMTATARLVRDAADLLAAGGLLALEVDARRASLVAELLARDSRYREVGVRLDLFGRERFVIGRREAR